MPAPHARLIVVIPTLNAAATLPACLRALSAGTPSAIDLHEIIIADGGSTDDVAACAERHRAHLIRTRPGRGIQMAAGAQIGVQKGTQIREKARASSPPGAHDYLLFLHADTALSENWGVAAAAFIAARTERGDGAAPEAGVFRLRFHGGGWRGAIIARSAMFRTRFWSLPYGDQGLLIRADDYTALGGFAPLPLFEDVDFIDRLKQAGGRITVLDADAMTSPARYEPKGYAARVLRNARCFRAYRRGVPMAELMRMYHGGEDPH